MADVRQLIALCQNKRVYIQTHNFPDPDAIGSAYGLQRLLERYSIPTKICYDGKIDKLSTERMLELLHIEMLSADEVGPELREDDCIICVDSQKGAGNITDFVGDEIAAIDHHPTYREIAYRYSDIRKVGACSTIIAEYYKDRGLTPDPVAATALLYGVKMDTMNFTRGVTEADIRAFSFLLPYVDQRTMGLLEHSKIEFQDLKAYGAAIENTKVYGYYGFSHIPFSCPDAMVAMLSDFILSLVEVEVAVIYCTRADGYKFSVRSERADVDAGALTRRALEGLGDGGGHAAMAGGLIPTENVPLLGNYPDDFLRERFLRVQG